jgi:DNA invertase Pin-like site-specific DNA recombinase
MKLLDRLDEDDVLIVTKMDRLGRPWTLDEAQRAEVRAAISAGASVSAVAKQLAVSRQTVMRARDENLK